VLPERRSETALHAAADIVRVRRLAVSIARWTVWSI